MTEGKRWSLIDQLSAKFTVTGFPNWKKAVLSGAMKLDGKHSAGSFQKYERSEAHVKALVAFTTSQQGNDTASLLSEAFKMSKIKRRAAMTVIFECYRFLARQGLPFRSSELIFRTPVMLPSYSSCAEGSTPPSQSGSADRQPRTVANTLGMLYDISATMTFLLLCIHGP